MKNSVVVPGPDTPDARLRIALEEQLDELRERSAKNQFLKRRDGIPKD